MASTGFLLLASSFCCLRSALWERSGDWLDVPDDEVPELELDPEPGSLLDLPEPNDLKGDFDPAMTLAGTLTLGEGGGRFEL